MSNEISLLGCDLKPEVIEYFRSQVASKKIKDATEIRALEQLFMALMPQDAMDAIYCMNIVKIQHILKLIDDILLKNVESEASDKESYRRVNDCSTRSAKLQNSLAMVMRDRMNYQKNKFLKAGI